MREITLRTEEVSLCAFNLPKGEGPGKARTRGGREENIAGDVYMNGKRESRELPRMLFSHRMVTLQDKGGVIG